MATQDETHIVHKGLAGVLLGEKNLPTTFSYLNKKEIMEKAHHALILSSGDKPMRQMLVVSKLLKWEGEMLVSENRI
ncbi:hypothetical protein MTR_1g115825 [Medicago truncatula]|uniref:Uncharacterized protein n=1 Tax=Medicago truncatula TaxID=3880 RepID=A0A072VR96_MEDTR|nr:hypothetical protein MTR_1g115825 [Medicago truncatula]